MLNFLLFKNTIKNKLYLSIFCIILFSFLYKLADYIENSIMFDWTEYLHFSLITQSTVGYGFQYGNIQTNIEKTHRKSLFQIINMLQLCSILYCGLQ